MKQNILEAVAELKLPPYTEQALKDYLLHGARPGHYLQAVLTNDLQGAVAFGDKDNLVKLAELAQFLYSAVPIACKDIDTWCMMQREEREKIWRLRGQL